MIFQIVKFFSGYCIEDKWDENDQDEFERNEKNNGSINVDIKVLKIIYS